MTLLILGHPDYANSLANREIVRNLSRLIPDLEVRSLGELYPDFKIDVAQEQAALLRHKTVIFQFPVYWYNFPALLKHWFDSVLTYGFAYGPGGESLKGRHLVVSGTTGSAEADYSPTGKQCHDIQDFWKNIRQTANLTQMVFHKPMFKFAAMSFGDATREAEIKTECAQHATKVADLVESL